MSRLEERETYYLSTCAYDGDYMENRCDCNKKYFRGKFYIFFGEEGCMMYVNMCVWWWFFKP